MLMRVVCTISAGNLAWANDAAVTDFRQLISRVEIVILALPNRLHSVTKLELGPTFFH